MPSISLTIKTILIGFFVAFLGTHLWTRFSEISGVLLFSYSTSAVFSQGQWWKFFTSPWIHSDVLSLVINMLVVGFLGSELDRLWGSKRFLFFYSACAYLPIFIFTILDLILFNGTSGLFLGPTSAVYGLLMAYGILFAERQMLFMMVIPVKAKHFIWILVAIDLLSALAGGRTLAATGGHLSGMLVGLVFLWAMAKWKARARLASSIGTGKKEKNTKGHLKLVVSNEEKQENEKNKGSKPGARSDSEDPPTWH